MPEAIVVLTTAADDEQARAIGRHLVERRLVACVNIVPRVQSIYTWEGKLVQEDEALLVCKTRPERFEAVRAAIREIHSYDVPEVLALEVPQGDAAYLAWLRDGTG
jgi:periplasmic divalent cation tolerance protein